MNALEGRAARGCAGGQASSAAARRSARCPLRAARWMRPAVPLQAPSAEPPCVLGSAFLCAASEQPVSHTALLHRLTPRGREACDEGELSSSLAANVTLPVIHAQGLLLAPKDVFHAIFMRGSYFKLLQTDERRAPFICMSELMSVQSGTGSAVQQGMSVMRAVLPSHVSSKGSLQMDRLPTRPTTTMAALGAPHTAKMLSAISTDQRQFCGSWVSRVAASLQKGKLGITVTVLLPDLSKGMRW